MNESAQNIIEINPDEFGVIKYDFTKEMIAEQCKKYAAIKIIPGDVESYEAAKAAKNKLVKTRTGTDKHRLKIGTKARAHIDRANAIAKDLLSPLLPIEANLKAMIKEEDDRIAQVEQDRIDAIEKRVETLAEYIKGGQAYNLSADEIQARITMVEKYDILAVDFEEKTEQAEALRVSGLETLERIILDRIKWEAEQAEAERQRVAEVKRLAADKAEFEAARVAERERQAKADKLVAQEAEKLRKANEEVKRKLLALEKGNAIIQAERQAALDAQKAADEAAKVAKDIKAAVANAWDHAHKDNKVFDAGWARAKGIDQAIEKARLQADKKRAKLISKDKLTADTVINWLDLTFSEYMETVQETKTKECTAILLTLTEDFKAALLKAEIAVKDLA